MGFGGPRLTGVANGDCGGDCGGEILGEGEMLVYKELFMSVSKVQMKVYTTTLLAVNVEEFIFCLFDGLESSNSFSEIFREDAFFCFVD